MAAPPQVAASPRVGRAVSSAWAVSPAPTMTDVAKVAGVSHQTVSRVLNEHPSVRPTTRARVIEAIAQVGYRPNLAARALVTGGRLTTLTYQPASRAARSMPYSVDTGRTNRRTSRRRSLRCTRISARWGVTAWSFCANGSTGARTLPAAAAAARASSSSRASSCARAPERSGRARRRRRAPAGERSARNRTDERR